MAKAGPRTPSGVRPSPEESLLLSLRRLGVVSLLVTLFLAFFFYNFLRSWEQVGFDLARSAIMLVLTAVYCSLPGAVIYLIGMTLANGRWRRLWCGRRGTGCCVACDYPLPGPPGRCPECGFDNDAGEFVYRSGLTPRRVLWVMTGIALVCAAAEVAIGVDERSFRSEAARRVILPGSYWSRLRAWPNSGSELVMTHDGQMYSPD